MRLALATDSQRREPLSVLICCSTRHIARLIQVNLQREGYKTTVIFEMAEYVITGEQSFDLVIIDFDFGDGAWRKMLAQMKDLSSQNSPRLIGTISKGFAVQNPEFFQSGFEKVFTHPFNPKELVNSLK